MRFSATVFLSFVASALAYSVSVPSQTQGWTTSGAQRLVWQRVDTDDPTFTAVLTDVNYALKLVLQEGVNGNLGSIEFNEPQGGWPQGGGFRVNLIKGGWGEYRDSIFAQSGVFTIAPEQSW